MDSPIVPQNEVVTIVLGDASVDAIFADETAWFTQKQMMDVFEVTQQTISYHLGNLKAEGESVYKSYLLTADDGKTYSVIHYDLDTVVEVGFAARKSKRAKLLRTQVKEEYRKRVVRQIRLSERSQYNDVRNFIAQSSDYNPNDLDCRDYFATIQNKLLYAVTGMTAAEIIINRANGHNDHMGLYTWQGAALTKADAKIAKNYLRQDEMEDLAAIVTGLAAGVHMLMVVKSSTMRQWVTYVDQQIILYRCKLLMGKGGVSHDQAMKIVDREYGIFKSLLVK